MLAQEHDHAEEALKEERVSMYVSERVALSLSSYGTESLRKGAIVLVSSRAVAGKLTPGTG